jgi:hypothetical protein
MAQRLPFEVSRHYDICHSRGHGQPNGTIKDKLGLTLYRGLHWIYRIVLVLHLDKEKPGNLYLETDFGG